MKASPFIKIILVVLVVISAGGAYLASSLYQSHDVGILRDHYPHLNEKKKFDFKVSKPTHWVSLDNISPFAVSAIVLTEDWGFYQHGGIDYNQLQLVLSDLGTVKKLRGASTITQQTVKNIFLSDERTFSRKLHEFILSYKLEDQVTKNRILETYLNSIEYGPNIIGIKKASKHYFSKNAKDLSPREGAFLAMMLPSPIRYYRSFRKKKLSTFAKKRIQEILEKLRVAKVISRNQYDFEMQQKFFWEL